MSVDHDFYLGAYLEVSVVPKEIISVTRECSLHGIHKEAKFCPDCGKKIREVENKREEPTRYWNIVSNELEDSLRELSNGEMDGIGDDTLILISNYIEGDHLRLDKYSDSGIMQIPDEESCKKEFAKKFIREIEEIRTHRKVMRFVIKFGLISYWT